MLKITLIQITMVWMRMTPMSVPRPIPTTSAQSRDPKWLFSAAVQIITKHRSYHGRGNVELLLLMPKRNEKWRK